MVEVFKTNISTLSEAEEISSLLSRELSSYRISFDLEDCDKILKIEAAGLNTDTIISLVTGSGYLCEVLE